MSEKEGEEGGGGIGSRMRENESEKLKVRVRRWSGKEVKAMECGTSGEIETVVERGWDGVIMS
jgi:hypothetical protein